MTHRWAGQPARQPFSQRRRGCSRPGHRLSARHCVYGYHKQEPPEESKEQTCVCVCGSQSVCRRRLRWSFSPPIHTNNTQHTHLHTHTLAQKIQEMHLTSGWFLHSSLRLALIECLQGCSLWLSFAVTSPHTINTCTHTNSDRPFDSIKSPGSEPEDSLEKNVQCC